MVMMSSEGWAFTILGFFLLELLCQCVSPPPGTLSRLGGNLMNALGIYV